MSYRVITGNKNVTVFIIICVGLIIWLPSFIINEDPGLSFSKTQMPLYELINDLLAGQDLVAKIIAFILVLIQGILICGINLRFALFQKRTFLPALLYIIMTGYLLQLHHLNEVLIASLFVNIILRILMNSYKEEPNSYRFFDAGIILGLGMMFYAPMIYLLSFIWLSTAVLRSFSWREYVYPVLGILIPFTFYLTYLFLNDIDIQKYFELLKNELYGGFPELVMNWPELIFSVYSILIVLISSIHMFKVFQFRKIYVRNYFMLLFWLFIISLIIFILLSGFNMGMIYIIAIPVTFIITNYFISARDTWLKKMMLYILIFSAVFAVISESFI